MARYEQAGVRRYFRTDAAFASPEVYEYLEKLAGKGDHMQINELLKLLVEKGASDLHLMVASPPVFRINGKIVPQTDIAPLSQKELEEIFDVIAVTRNDWISLYNLQAAKRLRVISKTNMTNLSGN